MSRIWEAVAFGSLAILLHVGLFSLAPETGAQSSGAGGDRLVSIQAANATLVDLVETWERPIQADPQLQSQLKAPLAPEPAPRLPRFDLAVAPRAAVQTVLVPPDMDKRFSADIAAPPPPPPEPEPEPKPEPQAKPVPPSPKAPKPRPKPETPREPARKAAETAPPQVEERAAGSGGTAHAGRSGGAEAASGTAGQQAKLKSIWGAKIRARIDRRKRYPSGARGSGRVVVQLTVSRSGQLVSARIVTSSGTPAFDQAAMRAISRAGKFPSAPKNLDVSELRFSFPMRFSK